VRHGVRMSVLAVGAITVLGACGSSSKSGSSSTTTTAYGSSATSAAPATTAAAAGAALNTATNAKVGKPIVVDGSGMTVYMFQPNGTSKTSTVPAGVKANWPAVKASGTPTAGTGLDQSKLTVNMQADGTNQLAYAGHLLYTFVGDKAAGDANGQGLGSVWFVLSPAGDKIG
jgi:predicted lipoprotein with Yx(FWY)xxD motif